MQSLLRLGFDVMTNGTEETYTGGVGGKEGRGGNEVRPRNSMAVQFT